MSRSTLVPTTNPTYASGALAEADMNEDLAAECETIKARINKAVAQSLEFHHWLGHRAIGVHSNTARYGSGAIEKMSAAVGIDKSTVYKCMTFHGLFPTAAELKAVVERRSVVGNKPLTWSHVMLLVHADRAAVPGLVEEFFQHGWTVREMEREIRRRAFAGTAGPRPTPRTILGGLSQFTSMSTRLVAKFEEDFDQTVANPLGEVDGTQINDQLLDRVRASEEALADLSTRAGERAAELRTLLQGLETAAKEAVTAAAEAAEEGAAAESAEPAKAAKPKAAKPKAAKPAAKAKPAKAHKSARSKGKPQPKAGKRQRRPIPA